MIPSAFVSFSPFRRISVSRSLPSAALRAGLAFVLAVSLSSCSNMQPTAGMVPVTGASLSGSVHGGQQPIVGAQVQLYAVGTGGDGTASTALLATPVVTGPLGVFTITGLYTCPSASSLVYLLATGGNPGLGLGTNNTASALMAALGPCGNLTPTTSIFIDEVTTVASTSALSPFMTSPTAVGSSAAHLQQLTDAFARVNQLVDTSTGASPGPALPSGSTAPVAAVNTLSDVLATCINTTGGTAGDGSACGMLFTDATPPSSTAPTDTVTAALDIALHPTQNVSQIFLLSSSNGPFQPTLTSAPATWALGISPGVTIVVAPSSAQVRVGATQQFTATVTNGVEGSATYSVNGVEGGNSTVGTITNGGLYTAPAAVPNPATVTITAVANADVTQSSTASVTVLPAISVSVSPTTASVNTGATQQFTATVANVANQGVTWTLSGASCTGASCGTISASGNYTAPATVPSPNATVTVTATAMADATKTGTATVTVAAVALSVSISPSGTTSVPLLGTKRFTATVTGDSLNKGVNWTLACVKDGFDDDADCAAADPDDETGPSSPFDLNSLSGTTTTGTTFNASQFGAHTLTLKATTIATGTSGAVSTTVTITTH